MRNNQPFEFVAVHTCRTSDEDFDTLFPFPDPVPGDRLDKAIMLLRRSLSIARKSEGWLRAVREGRTPLLMYPKEGASDASAIRARMARGESFFLVAIDGTWSEAKEMLDKGDGGGGGGGAGFECLGLAPETHDVAVGVYGGCRKPVAPGCFCTLEAVALALRALDPNGAELSHALLRPLLKQVDHQMVACDGRQTHRVSRPGYIPDLHATAERAAVRAGVTSKAWDVAQCPPPAVL